MNTLDSEYRSLIAIQTPEEYKELCTQFYEINGRLWLLLRSRVITSDGVHIIIYNEHERQYEFRYINKSKILFTLASTCMSWASKKWRRAAMVDINTSDRYATLLVACRIINEIVNRLICYTRLR